MKKKLITILNIVIFVLFGISCGMIGHLTVKKYFYKNYINKEIKKELVYYDNLSISSKPNIIEIEKTEKTTTLTTVPASTKTTTTTKIITTTTTTTSKTTIPTTEKLLEEKENIKEEVIVEANKEKNENNEIVLDDMTLNELTDKLNKSLNSTLTNTGHYFANYYVKTGLDPYLSVAIVLHETGCKWTCSKLVRNCNNVGGIKGKPSCNGGSYKSFNTLEEGINSYLDMLYNNYYSKGLNTPELINPKYAASTTWSEKINNYILEIKSK